MLKNNRFISIFVLVKRIKSLNAIRKKNINGVKKQLFTNTKEKHIKRMVLKVRRKIIVLTSFINQINSLKHNRRNCFGFSRCFNKKTMQYTNIFYSKHA